MRCLIRIIKKVAHDLVLDKNNPVGRQLTQQREA